MDRYEKGEVNEEGGLTIANIPITVLPPDHGWILLSEHSKVVKLTYPAVRSLDCDKSLVIAGSGENAIQKVSSLATSVKRDMKNKKIYEIRKKGSRQIDEYWIPTEEGLAPLMVSRHVPTLHILLSIQKIDTSESDISSSGGRRKSNTNHHKNKSTNNKNLSQS